MNLIFFIVFIVGIIFIIIVILSSLPDQIDKMVDEANKRRIDAIKKGIRNSKILGTKKSRR